MYIAICDDHIETARDLQRKILDLPLDNIGGINIFTDPDELIFAAEDLHYDVVFMDIELGSISGIELSARLLRIHPDMQIIFISGYDDYYLQVYDVEHIFFLRKPIETQRLMTALETAQDRILTSRDEFLPVKIKRSILRIPQSGIMYIEKDKRMIRINMVNGEIYNAYGKLPELLESLNDFFFQCHTSYIINFRYIREMSEKKFILIPTYAGVASCKANGPDETEAAAKSEAAGKAELSKEDEVPKEIEIPISRKYYHEAREKFLRHLV